MAVMSTEKRKGLSDTSFALPSKRKYPINDESHARNALARASQFASPEEKSKIRSAVHRRFPGITQQER